MPTPINHYEGPVKRANTATGLGRLLKDQGWAEEWFDRLEKGDMTFHDHPKSKVCHQVWTDEKAGYVACQKYLGHW